MIDQLKPLIGKLTIFAKDRMGFEHPPRLFLRNDPENSQKMLGKTAHYDPQEKAITLFTRRRHPKDILRSYAHELVHHTQNLRGDLSPEKCGEMGQGYAQANGHMREMEREAYEKGNMCFRDWEDTLSDKDTYIIIKIAESKTLKENKTMTKKITKEFLKETIRKILAENPSMETGMEDINTAIGQVAASPELQGTDSELDPAQLQQRIEQTVIAALKKGSPEGLRQAADMMAQIQADMSSTPGVAAAAPAPLEENEELEEASQEEFAKNRPPYDKATAEDRAGDDGKSKNESKIQTPEQEISLYESRFAARNNRLFENLTKKWTK